STRFSASAGSIRPQWPEPFRDPFYASVPTASPPLRWIKWARRPDGAVIRPAITCRLPRPRGCKPPGHRRSVWGASWPSSRGPVRFGGLKGERGRPPAEGAFRSGCRRYRSPRRRPPAPPGPDRPSADRRGRPSPLRPSEPESPTLPPGRTARGQRGTPPGRGSSVRNIERRGETPICPARRQARRRWPRPLHRCPTYRSASRSPRWCSRRPPADDGRKAASPPGDPRPPGLRPSGGRQDPRSFPIPVLNRPDFGHPPTVAAAGEIRRQPDPDDLPGQSRPDDALTQGQHIGIVVFPAHPRRKLVAHHGAANPLHLVGGYGHPDAGPADEDAPVKLSLRHPLRDGKGIIGIIHRLGAVTAHILVGDAHFLQQVPDFLLQMKPAVIRSDDDAHPSAPLKPIQNNGAPSPGETSAKTASAAEAAAGIPCTRSGAAAPCSHLGYPSRGGMSNDGITGRKNLQCPSFRVSSSRRQRSTIRRSSSSNRSAQRR